MESVRATVLVPAGVPASGIVTVAEAILLAVSVAVFIYLGIAMFMPERF
jgi:K+-transporting ATPase KdpF subunit